MLCVTPDICLKMTFKYYYDLLSQPSRALYIILNMSKTTFKDCPVSLTKGEHLSSEFRERVNRFQKVPCIVEEDTGFKLAESVAILRYLGAKRLILPELYPSDAAKQCRVDEFLEWQHITVRAGCALYFWGVWLEPKMTGEQPSTRKVERLVQTMEKHLETMETVWLENANQKFLCGDQMSAADIFGACEIEQTLMTPYNVRERYPRIAAWLGRVQTSCNPHYENAHKVVYKIAAKNRSQGKGKL